MSSGRNVLVLTPWFPPSPGERVGCFVYDQIKALTEIGANIFVLVLLPWIPYPLRRSVPAWKLGIRKERYSDCGFEVQVARYFNLPAYRLGSLTGPVMSIALWSAISKIVRQYAIDLIHAHTETIGYVGVKAAEQMGIPSVVTLHGINTMPQLTNTARKRQQLRKTLEVANRVILVGSSLQLYFERFVDTTGNFIVVPNGFQIPPLLEASKRIPKTKSLRIVSASNLFESKGVHLTIEALAVLARCGLNDVELVIVGDGDQRSLLSSRSVELELDNRVHFTGYLSHPETLAEIAAGDIFCLPSWQEACGIVYLEAMGLGKVAIGCKGQGPSDYMIDGQTGYLIEPGSLDSLVHILSVILTAWESVSSVGTRAKEHAYDHLTWQQNAGRIVRIYREEIAKG